MNRSASLLIIVLCVGWAISAFATPVSTADPNYPAYYDDIDSGPLRDQFNKIINDIDSLWSAVGPRLLNANQLFGALEDGVSQAIPMPSCFSSTSGLIWTPGIGFGCNRNLGGSGTISSPGTSSLGGIFALSAQTSNSWVSYIDTNGVQHTSQPSFGNISGSLSVGQITGASSAPSQYVLHADGSWSPAVSGIVAAANGGTGCGTAGCYYGLPNWRTALDNVKHGIGNAHLCIVSDSTAFGVGANGSGAATGQNYYSLSWPTQLATALQRDFGIPAYNNSFFGDGATTNYNASGGNDPRVTVGSSWSQDLTVNSFGYSTFKATTNTNALSFTPTVSVDTFRVFYVIDQSQGTLQADVNGSNSSTYNTAGNASVGIATISAALGTNTLNLRWSSGGQVNIIGAEAYDSTHAAVIIDNGGSSAATSANMAVTTKAYGGGNSAVYAALGCNLTIVASAINDWVNAVPLVTYSSNLQTVVTAAGTSGDVLLASEVPTSPGVNSAPSNAVQQTYVDAMRALAQTNGLPFNDVFRRWQSFALANAYGFYGDTYTHPNGAGYYEIAENFSFMIAAAPGQGDENFALNSHIFVNQSNNNVGINQPFPSAKLDVNGNSIVIEQSTTPADNAACTAGTIWWDTGFIYLCTSSGTVKRAALSTF